MFQKASTEQFRIAQVICSILSRFVPDQPIGVDVAIEDCQSSSASHAVMRIRFQPIGIELYAVFYIPQGSSEMLLSELHIQLQPILSIFRTQQLHLSYEELSLVLGGTGLLTVNDARYFNEFMYSEMSAQLRKLTQPSAEPEVQHRRLNLVA